MRTLIHTYSATVVLLVVALLTGCTTPPSAGRRLESARAAYSSGDYASAYVEAERAAGANTPSVRHEAAYIAGMSAHQRRDLVNAERFLKLAAQSSDPALAGQALAELGLIYGELGWHAQAARYLLAASSKLQGQDRVNAYFYAAVAQQKMGQWAQARTNLTLAQSQSQDPALKARAAEQLLVTGYTLQFGAFANQLNAEKEAQRRAIGLSKAKIGPARISAALTADNRQLHLVQAGYFTTFDSAIQARNRIGIEAVVVPLKGTGG
jgi:tetratricopeptide (TPR) repeat protein